MESRCVVPCRGAFGRTSSDPLWSHSPSWQGRHQRPLRAQRKPAGALLPDQSARPYPAADHDRRQAIERNAASVASASGRTV